MYAPGFMTERQIFTKFGHYMKSFLLCKLVGKRNSDMPDAMFGYGASERALT